MKKIILDLCGSTGAWSRPYKEAGYDVTVITLPDFDVIRWREYPETDIPVNSQEVYGILAAPPCTMFSLARQTAKTPRDLISAMKIVRACMDIIWTAHPKFWVMENPVGILRQFMGKPAMTFQPFMFGDLYQKKTDLWGYFNIPERSMRSLNQDQLLLMKDNNRQMPPLPEDYILPEGESRYSARRAITPPGFAKHFMRLINDYSMFLMQRNRKARNHLRFRSRVYGFNDACIDYRGYIIDR